MIRDDNTQVISAMLRVLKILVLPVVENRMSEIRCSFSDISERNRQFFGFPEKIRSLHDQSEWSTRSEPIMEKEESKKEIIEIDEAEHSKILAIRSAELLPESLPIICEADQIHGSSNAISPLKLTETNLVSGMFERTIRTRSKVIDFPTLDIPDSVVLPEFAICDDIIIEKFFVDWIQEHESTDLVKFNRFSPFEKKMR
jgi:hypothetical protein